jgi:hypothetical protein
MDPITCSRCDAVIPPAHFNAPDFMPCPSCRVPLKVEVFPAVFRRASPETAGESAVADEASCFYHPAKRADSTCDYCGRFLCSLCEIEMGGSRLCPSCLESGRKKGRLANLDRSRTLHDSTALRVAIFPLILVWPTIITAPIAIYLALRHWKAPMGVVRRSRFRFVLAIIIAGLQVLAWASGITYLVWFARFH